MAAAGDTTNSSSSLMAARRLYLSVYNWVLFFGWAQVVWYAKLAFLESGHEAVYAAIRRPLLLAQTAALMEILHSAVGFVRSPISSTARQVYGRLFVTWAVLWSVPETRSHILVTPLILSWSITEVIRYPFYGMEQTFGFAPSWLVWLRYSTFIVLYPTGFLCEVGLVYAAQLYTKKHCLAMPNKWDFSYAYALNIPLYVYGFLYLYRYMLGRRKKILSKAKTA